jgi:hypothetical protein
MNYSLIEEPEENELFLDKYKDIDEKNIALTIMDDYNKLTNNLEKLKKEYNDLHKQREYFYNYQNNIYNSHLNILDIIKTNDNKDNLNELLINYNSLTKDIYNDWYISTFEPQKKKMEMDIEINENTLIKFRRMFINIINKLINNNDDVINKKMCPICFDNEIDMCSVPCGHTCCNKCVISSRGNYNNYKKCLNCRNDITEYIKIYFLI